MKKLWISAAIVAGFAGTLRAQKVNNIRLSNLREDYIEINAEYSASSETSIELNYGQRDWRHSDFFVRDDAGKKMIFNSAIDFINKMKNYNYELFQVYTDASKKYYVLKHK